MGGGTHGLEILEDCMGRHRGVGLSADLRGQKSNPQGGVLRKLKEDHSG